MKLMKNKVFQRSGKQGFPELSKKGLQDSKRSGKKKIILDTNFLLIPQQFRVDIFSEIKKIADFKYDLFIIDKTIDELKRIIESKQKQKNKLAAKIALQLIKKKKIKKIKTKENNVDKAILKIANKKNYLVSTQDKVLKSKLRKKSIPLIILRQKSYLKIS